MSNGDPWGGGWWDWQSPPIDENQWPYPYSNYEQLLNMLMGRMQSGNIGGGALDRMEAYAAPTFQWDISDIIGGMEGMPEQFKGWMQPDPAMEGPSGAMQQYQDLIAGGPEGYGAAEIPAELETNLQNLYQQAGNRGGWGAHQGDPANRISSILDSARGDFLRNPQDADAQATYEYWEKLQARIDKAKQARLEAGERAKVQGKQEWGQKAGGLQSAIKDYQGRQQQGFAGLAQLMGLGAQEQGLKNQMASTMIGGIPRAEALNLQEFQTMLGGLQGFRGQDMQLVLAELQAQMETARAKAMAGGQDTGFWDMLMSIAPYMLMAV